ncbi:hypothetical protein ACF1BP_00500 [Streptomyces sp. NPDC014735]|uniref:hypothetical protein n=1 Tax=unclassified Streptomyces TaxID=2593676 RepID=UPI0036FDA294
MVQKPESDTDPKEKRIDLSLPQVAGSAVAAVAAAVAASQLGVYGTILGAGVMSVVATCGGSVFQHFFRRTGEQIREATVQAKHQGREAAGRNRRAGDARASRGERRSSPEPGHDGVEDATTVLPAVDATTVLPAVDATTVLRAVDATTVLRAVDADQDPTRPTGPFGATRPLAAVRPGRDGAPDEEFSEVTTHGTRFRGWKRSAAGAAVVFVVAMAGITTYELVSGGDLSGGRGTTVGSVVRGGGRDSGTNGPAPSTDTGPARDRTPGQESGEVPGTAPGGGQSRNPDSGQDGRAPADPAPSPTRPGDSGEGTGPSPATTPAPSAPGDGGVAPQPTDAGQAPAQGGQATTGTDTGR